MLGSIFYIGLSECCWLKVLISEPLLVCKRGSSLILNIHSPLGCDYSKSFIHLQGSDYSHISYGLFEADQWHFSGAALIRTRKKTKGAAVASSLILPVLGRSEALLQITTEFNYSTK